MSPQDGSARAAGAGVSGAEPQPRQAVLAELARRTEALAARPEPSAEELARQRERERTVVRESRYLLRLLSTRRRSAGEMRERLRSREVPGAIAHEVMARIGRAGLVDDAAFAHDWVEQRRRLRGLSDEALRRELLSREVDPTLIDRALAAGESDEEERARALIRERLRREKDLPGAGADRASRVRAARRLEGYLRRRGHDGALIRRVVSSELLHATGR